jgi:hypothetical protein
MRDLEKMGIADVSQLVELNQDGDRALKQELVGCRVKVVCWDKDSERQKDEYGYLEKIVLDSSSDPFVMIKFKKKFLHYSSYNFLSSKEKIIKIVQLKGRQESTVLYKNYNE